MMPGKADRLDFDLYPVTCEKLSLGRSDLEILDALIAGGAQVVQLREKELSMREFFDLAKAFREKTRRAGMTFIVNDHVDVCRAVAADGVHLGQDDFPVRAARKLLGSKTIIGVSTHTLEQALKAVEEGADYINVGPIFPTRTKEHPGDPVGLELFREVQRRVAIPITVMGGINLDNLDAVLEAGARRVAVVSAVVGARDVAQTVKVFRERIRNYPGSSS
jgi:thiamine-phosphate pyrophosphorylase